MKEFSVAKMHLIARPIEDHGKRVLLSPDFETGIVKVLRGEEDALTAAEIKSLSRLKRVDEATTDKGGLSFAEKCEKELEKKPSKYINLEWIPGTSNEVECSFSDAGMVLTERRQGIFPSTLKNLLMLEYNDKMWDVYTVSEALRKASVLRKEAVKKKQRTI